MASFQLPDQHQLAPLLVRFPGRELQVNLLSTLLSPLAAPCKRLVVYGTEATGKSVVAEAVLQALSSSAVASLPVAYAIVPCAHCITPRHLYERTAEAVAAAVGWPTAPPRCESLSQLVVELGRMLHADNATPGRRFVLVLDGIDRQREAPPALLPSLARLPELIPNLTCVLIATSLLAGLLRVKPVPYVHFPNYTKSEFVRILAASPPAPLSLGPSQSPDESTDAVTAELWTRFCGAVHDGLARPAARSLLDLTDACRSLWPVFTAPIAAGTVRPRDFPRLLVTARAHLQDETLLDPGILAIPSEPAEAPDPCLVAESGFVAVLPRIARLLLVAAYLAAYNAARHDLTLFSTHYHGRARRGGSSAPSTPGRSRGKHRQIARRLLGSHAFTLERMMAIFAAVRNEWVAGDDDAGLGAAGLDADVAMAISTLVSLRLLLRVGAAVDLLDRGGKWRANIGWGLSQALGKSLGVNLGEWLIE